MQRNRSLFAAAATTLVAIAGLALAPAAQARSDVYWSVGIGSPGVSIGASNAYPVYTAPAPVYVQPAPVYVQSSPYYRAAPVYVQPAPVYVQPAPIYWGPGYRHGHGHHRRHGHGHGNGWNR
jgi:PXPV repeat (3 copies)